MHLIFKNYDSFKYPVKAFSNCRKLKLLTNKQCADFLGVTRSAFARRKDRIYYKIAITVIKATEAELFMNFPRKRRSNEILG